MKIGLLLRRQVSGPGGAEATLKHLARGLSQAGHQVTVYGAGANPAGAKSLGPGVAYVRVPVWGGKTLRRLCPLPSIPAASCWPGAVEVVLSLERVPCPPGLPGRGRLPPGMVGPPGPLSLPPGPGRPALQPLSPGDALIERRLFHLPGPEAGDRQLPAGAGEIIRHYRGGPGPHPGDL